MHSNVLHYNNNKQNNKIYITCFNKTYEQEYVLNVWRVEPAQSASIQQGRLPKITKRIQKTYLWHKTGILNPKTKTETHWDSACWRKHLPKAAKIWNKTWQQIFPNLQCKKLNWHRQKDSLSLFLIPSAPSQRCALEAETSPGPKGGGI